MKRLILASLFLFSLQFGFAQVTEVNPNIKWRFVRSQTIDFADGKYYQFEFPAETGFDYIFNLTHSLDSGIAQIYVYDLQYQPVAQVLDSSSAESTDLHFDVTSDGTYIVVLKLESNADIEAILPSTLSLVRREKV